jgi:hypothetical protein
VILHGGLLSSLFILLQGSIYLGRKYGEEEFIFFFSPFVHKDQRLREESRVGRDKLKIKVLATYLKET